MKNDLLFDFTVDKTTKTVFINREFNADLSLVWDAFTKPEILDQWNAPKPWTAKTKFMNFEVGKSIPYQRKIGIKFSGYGYRFCCFVNGKIK